MNASIWTLSLILAAATSAASDPQPAQTGINAEDKAVVVTVQADDDGQVKQDVRVFRLDGGPAMVDADGNPRKAVFITKGGDDAANPHARVMARVSAAGDPNRGWLGVALGETIEKDGNIEPVENGVVVMNVVKDSPAEVAGLQSNDVITALNGAPVTEGVSGLSKLIGELGPGAEARLSVLRDDKPVELVATLASPKVGGIQWLQAPDMTIRERIRLQPHVGMVTPQGQWQMFDIDLDGMDDLPAAIAKMAGRGTSVQVSIENGERVIEVSSNDDGAITEVSQEGEGPITVKRYTEGQDDITETQYADANALAAADAEAFELFDHHANRSTNVWVDNSGDVFTFNTEFFADDVHEQIMKSLDGASLSAEAMQEAHEALRKAFEGHALMIPPPGAGGVFFGVHKAARTFKVTSDGKIEVTLRRGDSEVVKVYENEADLAARDPAAFERYQSVMNAEIEE